MQYKSSATLTEEMLHFYMNVSCSVTMIAFFFYHIPSYSASESIIQAEKADFDVNVWIYEPSETIALAWKMKNIFKLK